MKTCARGHTYDRPRCPVCRSAAQQRYTRTPKGRATLKRYRQSPKGKLRKAAVAYRWYHYNGGRERQIPRMRRWYQTNRESCLKRMRQNYAKTRSTYGSLGIAFWANQMRFSE